MTFDFQCPECGTGLRVVERMMGRDLLCPHCDARISIPSMADFQRNLAATRPENSGDPANDRVVGSVADEDIWEAEPVDEGAVTTGATAMPVNQGPAATLVLPASATEGDEEPSALARKSRDDGELDMTPMVDVTFLLLIFFMVTASFSLQKSLPMPQAQSEQPSTTTVDEEDDDKETVTVEIDEFNGFLIISNEFERECASKLAVTTALREAFNPSAGGMRLAIVVHENAKLQSLVDVMDAGTIANYAEVQITEVEQLD